MADDKSKLSDGGSPIRAGKTHLVRYREINGHASLNSHDESYRADHVGVDDLNRMARTIYGYKVLIASIVMLLTSIVIIVVLRAQPWYQASAVIEIGKDTSTVRSGELALDDDAGAYSSVLVNTKSLLLESSDLHEDVVLDLKLDENPAFSSLTGEDDSPTLWQSLRAWRKGLSETNEGKAPDPMLLAALQPEGENTRPPAESARLAPFVKVLKKNLTINQIKATRALELAFTHDDPLIAAAVANTLTRRFIQRNYENQTRKFTNAADWLDRMTKELKGKAEQSEQWLADYTRKNNIFLLKEGSKDTLTTEKLTRLHDQAIRAQTDRLLKQSLYEQLRAGRIAELPDAFTDSKIIALQKQFDDITTQAAQLKVRFGPTNPQIIEIERQRTTVQAQLETSLKALRGKLNADYERAVRDEKSLVTALNEAKIESVKENQADIRYSLLRQDVDTTRALYTDFLQKTNQAKALVAEQNGNINVIQHAKLPKDPAGPKRLLIIMLGFFTSIGVGIGAAFVLDRLDTRIKNYEDLDRFGQLPVLGVIPAATTALTKKDENGTNRHYQLNNDAPVESSQSTTNQLMAFAQGSKITEAYSALRTSVLLSVAGSSPNTILVASSKDGEGKTTTVINLAVAIARLKAKVLILDCDLRTPASARVLGAESQRGLSTYLSEDIELDDLILNLSIPNLSLLPSGPIPPDPTELISSQKMKEMLRSLTERFDYIVIDSPSITDVTDPIILSTLVDGVILLVHGGKTTRAEMQRSRQELLSVGAEIWGVVLNNVNRSRHG